MCIRDRAEGLCWCNAVEDVTQRRSLSDRCSRAPHPCRSPRQAPGLLLPEAAERPEPGSLSRGPLGHRPADPSSCTPRLSGHTRSSSSTYLAIAVLPPAPQLRPRSCWLTRETTTRGGGWWPASTEQELFNPGKVGTTRYQYRGAVIPSLRSSQHDEHSLSVAM